ncbi:M48 family peptidase [Thiospirochaeta perfilievii]|uniref:M48 family peptidase n=1 Tax=Thiospirochaeta perfilievii TaxID=252967 RepID=A0A5C1QC71_9SPIO|nr:SprT family zinc-dependent metalloprotease [Thiospirochaeta perfilievii]QEN04509.1 M48 family peptidase [Thiospirochaeta perfilievii]
MTSKLFYNYDKKQIPIGIKKSKRKSIVLNITSNGEVLVKAPNFITNIDIMSFIDKHKLWIERKLNEHNINSNRHKFIIGESIPLEGVNRELCKKNNITKTALIRDKIYIGYKKLDIERELIKWYRSYARKKLTSLSKYYCSELGVTFNNIYIKSTKTRWGSCSGKKNLNYNWKIILTPEHLIKYLVIHEVSHLVEMNHSVNFWKIVNRFDKNYKKNRAELHQHSYLLNYFLE